MNVEIMQKVSFRLFLETYNILVGYETPEIHERMATWLDETEDESSRMLQVFRHAGKSHMFGLYVAWRLARDPNYTCVIISAKSAIAARNSKMIRDLIITHPFCSHLRTKGVWSTLNFTVNRPIEQLDPSVTVTSLDSDFTGKHGNELIIDDIETSQNANSEEKRKHMRERIYEFRKIAPRLLFCGTPHHQDSVYTWLKSDFGVSCSLTIPILENDEPTWPDHPEILKEDTPDGEIFYRKFSKGWIDFTKRTTPDTDFKSQYMLIPCNIEPSVLNLDLIHEYDREPEVRELTIRNRESVFYTIHLDKPDEIKQMIGYLDTASGKPGRDKSVIAIIMVGTGSAPNYYLHRVFELPAIDENGWERLLERTANIVDEFHLPKLCFEKSVNLAFETDLQRVFKKHNIVCSLKDVQRTKNKEVYIQENLGTLIDSGRLYVHKQARQTGFWGQLQDFPNSKHDDSIDAAAGAIAEISHLGKTGAAQDNRALFGNHEVMKSYK